MPIKLLFLFYYIQTALSGVIGAICLLGFASKKSKTITLIGLLFFIGFLCNFGSYFLLPQFRNMPGSVYDLALGIILGILYNHVTHRRYARFFIWTTIIYLIFAIINLLLFQRADISSYNKLLSSFILIFYSVFYFYRLMVEMPTAHIQRLPMFWFNSAFLIYHAGTIFLFAFTTYLTDVLNDNLVIYWNFHNGLSIFEHFLILIGLYFHKLQRSNQAD